MTVITGGILICLVIAVAYLYHQLDIQKSMNIEMVKFILISTATMDFLTKQFDEIEKQILKKVSDSENTPLP
jgi:hypothetical protein